MRYASYAPWRAATNGAGARPWFVTREAAPDQEPYTHYAGAETLRDARGNVRRFGSRAAATKVAARMIYKEG